MPLITPDDYLSSVLVIEPELLYEQGFRVVLLDIDNTLVPRDSRVLTAEIKSWVASLSACGLRACLLSNNWHKTVFAYADELGIPIVYKAMKPAPFAFFKACKKVGRSRGEKVVMIGDQIVTDVWGARVFGAYAILVVPQAVKDLWYTLIFRRLEAVILRNKHPRK